MKTSEKLRAYFGSPSTMLEPLLAEVERLESDAPDIPESETRELLENALQRIDACHAAASKFPCECAAYSTNDCLVCLIAAALHA